jgi:2-dehydro-3-deoxyphosphogluconate aldolase/(4S)-4-hydroxy-2-oxoglutarate aldolase
LPDLTTVLADSGIVALNAAEAPDQAVAVGRAFAAAGLPVVEVVQRSENSLDCLEAVVRDLPDLIVGAGTVLSPEQAEACLARGARFIVSPGLDEDVVAVARQHAVAVFPGIMTPTELQHAHRLDLGIVKYFPAGVAGGVAALEALASVFRGMRFIPTGGISAANLAEYLTLPAVLACGGSWLAPEDAVAAGDFHRITSLAAEALAIARRRAGGRRP